MSRNVQINWTICTKYGMASIFMLYNTCYPI